MSRSNNCELMAQTVEKANDQVEHLEQLIYSQQGKDLGTDGRYTGLGLIAVSKAILALADTIRLSHQL